MFRVYVSFCPSMQDKIVVMCECMGWQPSRGFLPTCTAYLLLTHLLLYSRSHIWKNKNKNGFAIRSACLNYFLFLCPHFWSADEQLFCRWAKWRANNNIGLINVRFHYHIIQYIILLLSVLKLNAIKWPIRRHWYSPQAAVCAVWVYLYDVPIIHRFVRNRNWPTYARAHTFADFVFSFLIR